MTLAPNASEKLFESKVKQLCVMNGWKYQHSSPFQVRPGVYKTDGKGFPDLVLAHETRGLIFAELKTAVGKPSHEQMQWLKALAPWAEVYLWRPNDLDFIADRLGRAPK